MEKRGNNSSKAGKQALFSWKISIFLGGVGFAAFRWLFPLFFNRTPLMSALGRATASISWLILLVFSFIALISYLRHPQDDEQEPDLLASLVASGELPVSFLMQGTDKGSSDESRVKQKTKRDDQPPPLVNEWSLDAIRLLEWKRFERLCAEYYEMIGFKSKKTVTVPDGRIAMKLFKVEPDHPLAIIQCHAWSNPVGVSRVHELLKAMVHQKVRRCILITTGSYTKDALEFGKNKPIQLIDGEFFIKKVTELPVEKHQSLLKRAFEGDYMTPTCPSCGIRMVSRAASRGIFWGCANYPRCTNTLPARSVST